MARYSGEVKLVRPSIAYEDKFSEFINDFKVHDEQWYRGFEDALEDFQTYMWKSCIQMPKEPICHLDSFLKRLFGFYTKTPRYVG